MYFLLLLLYSYKFKNDELELDVDQLSSGLLNDENEPKSHFYQKKSNAYVMKKFRFTVVKCLHKLFECHPDT